jgi:phosphate transport system substrate-binding protein
MSKNPRKGGCILKARLIAVLFMVLCTTSVVFTPALAARSQQTVSLLGAGSTFDYPFFSKAFTAYEKEHSVQITYQAIGSGAGIADFIAKTVDFGATDVPMSGSDLANAEKNGPVEQIPITLGGVAIAYNLPGIKSGLHLSGSVLANIYLGKITTWNDKAIKKLNPKAKLPDLKIVVAHRSDSSGTSYIFTDYLSHVSKEWRTKVGTDKLPNWPVGAGGKGNPGVAAIVQQTPGAIGYVELAYVLQNHMTDARLQNRAHQFLYPSLKTVATAASHFPHISATHFSIVNAPGKGSYPICGYSWVLLYQHQTDTTKGKALVDLMKWMVTGGQKYAKSLDYVPLPKVVRQLALANLDQIKV